MPKRFTPLYEQHTLGYTLGNDGHASCAPTSAMAAMDWLSQGGAYLPGLIPSSVCGNDKVCWVGLMGLAMGTTGAAGTSGAGLTQGLNLWLDASGYTGSVDHEGGVMTPDQMVQLANAPGATILGIHNVPPDSGFGHVVVLDNAVPGPNGTAIVTIMDVNQEPNPGGAMQGAYRSFVMHRAAGSRGRRPIRPTTTRPRAGFSSTSTRTSRRTCSRTRSARRRCSPRSGRRVGSSRVS